MKYPFKSLLLAATVLAAASCAKDDTQSGGEETAGPVIVNASPAAILALTLSQIADYTAAARERGHAWAR